MLITDDAYEAGLAKLRAAAATQPGPVVDTLDLLVLRAAAHRNSALFGAKAGLPALAEWLYAAMVTLAAGGWIAAATAAGPVTSPVPQALVIGGMVLAVPWWAHRRRRARVRIERKLQAWPEIAQAVGLPGSQVMSALVDVWGWRSRIRLAVARPSPM